MKIASLSRAPGWRVAALASACLPLAVHAGAFALIDHSARALGLGYSDTVAGGEDASVLYMNPAGVWLLPGSQATASAIGLRVDSEFGDRGSGAAFGQPLGDTRANGGTSAVIPAMFGVFRTGRVTAGVGLFSPFGLASHYDSGWAGRFLAEKSEIRSYALNGTLAFELTPSLALGAGVERQRFSATLTNAVNYTAVIAAGTQAVLGAPVIVPGAVGDAHLRGDDDRWAYTLGLVWKPNDDLRVGLSYRSGSNFELRGNASFDPPALGDATLQAIANAALPSGPVTLRLKTPDTVGVGMVLAIARNLRVSAEGARTAWSSVQEQRILRADGSLLQLTTLNWKDAWRLAVGASYDWNTDVTLRAGFRHEASPIPDATRNARLPANTYVTFCTGVKVVLSPGRWIDLGLGYTRAKVAPIREDGGSATVYGLLLGEFRSSTLLAGAQYTQSF